MTITEGKINRMQSISNDMMYTRDAIKLAWDLKAYESIVVLVEYLINIKNEFQKGLATKK